MRPTATFHLRALVFAGAHFVFCALLGAALLAMTVADVLTTASEAPPPGWLGALYWLLSIFNAPMAGFFGLWQDTDAFHLPLLLLAGAWSFTLGYFFSLASLGVSRALAAKHEIAAKWSNPAHSLDAAMSFSLHIGRHWRGASDVRCWPRRGHFVKRQFLRICVCAALLQFASANTWEAPTHECSLTFPDAGWTFQEGATVPNGQMLLAALNRGQAKSVNLLSIRAPRSASVQDPVYSARFKRGFSAAGARPINDGYTNINGHLTYWLTGEKNILGHQVSTLSYSLLEGRTLYQIHVESVNTVAFADDELLAILASFQARGGPSLWPRFSLTGNSLAFCVGIIIGAAIVFRCAKSIRLKRAPRNSEEHPPSDP